MEDTETRRRCTKSLLRLCFKVLLLLCVLFLVVFSYATWMNVSFLEHYQKILNLTIQLPKSVHSGATVDKITTESRDFTSALPTAPPTGTLYHQAYPHNYHYIMDNKEVCVSKTPFLVLMVPVAPQNRAARDAIRKTWANESLVQGEVVRTLFMLGLPRNADDVQLKEQLEQENLQHHDLIQSSFLDSYLNLTIKTMVIMHWLATHCPTAAYAMKIDSDMFLNVDNLVKMLTLPGVPKENYLTGMLMYDREVLRDRASKWYVPKELFPDPRYPTYTLGMGYVFSNDLPKKFVKVSKTLKPFNIEDAYIGMCMKLLGLKPTPSPNPWQFKAYNTKYDRCIFSRVITFILGSSQEIINYWTDLKKPGKPC